MRQAAIFLFGFALCASAVAQDRLVFAVDVIRHGDRTPFEDIPTAPHRWAPGMAQLTARGVRQEYELGSRMRSIYVDRYRLLPPRYAPGTIYVRSTNVDRTLMSAQAFLAGLYPREMGSVIGGSGRPAMPDASQPIPVHTVPSSEETLLDPSNSIYRYDDLQARFVVPSTSWQERSAALRPQFARWSNAAGIQITDLQQIVSFGDIFLVRERHHVPPPQGLTAEDVGTIIDAWSWARAATLKPAQIGRTTGRELFKTIMGYFEDAVRGKTPLKYVLFAAHDTTILSELSALGAPLDRAPPYASRLNFSLFRSDEGGYLVDISLNDQPVAVPGCGGASCSLSQFAALLDQP